MEQSDARTLGELAKRIASGSLSQADKDRYQLEASPASASLELTPASFGLIGPHWESVEGFLLLRRLRRPESSAKLLVGLPDVPFFITRLSGLTDPDRAIEFLHAVPEGKLFEVGLVLPDYERAIEIVFPLGGLFRSPSDGKSLARLIEVAWDVPPDRAVRIAASMEPASRMREMAEGELSDLGSSIFAGRYAHDLYSTLNTAFLWARQAHPLDALTSAAFAGTGAARDFMARLPVPSLAELEELARLESATERAYASFAACEDIGELIECIENFELQKDPALMRKIIAELVIANNATVRDLHDSEKRSAMMREQAEKFIAVKEGPRLRVDAQDKGYFQKLVTDNQFVAERVTDIAAYYGEHCADRKQYASGTLHSWYKEAMPHIELKGGRPKKRKS